jgi:hypothetical protein
MIQSRPLGLGGFIRLQPRSLDPHGVTNALCGLVDTGSGLETAGEGGRLQASLQSEIHLFVVRHSTGLSIVGKCDPPDMQIRLWRSSPISDTVKT